MNIPDLIEFSDNPQRESHLQGAKEKLAKWYEDFWADLGRKDDDTTPTRKDTLV